MKRLILISMFFGFICNASEDQNEKKQNYSNTIDVFMGDEFVFKDSQDEGTVDFYKILNGNGNFIINGFSSDENKEDFKPIKQFQRTCLPALNGCGTNHNRFDHIQPDLFRFCEEIIKTGKAPKVFFMGAGRGAIPIDLYNYLKGKGNFIVNDLSSKNLVLLRFVAKKLKNLNIDCGDALSIEERIKGLEGSLDAFVF